MRTNLRRGALIAAFVSIAVPVSGQTVDEPVAAAFARATRAARARFAADRGALWGTRLDTIPWLGVAGRTILLTEDPNQPGFARRDDGLWSGPLPDGMTPANTSTTFAGRRWAMVVLPLGSDALGATRLLIHEASHVAQPSVLPVPPYSEGGAGAALLDEPAGREWMRLEWNALAAALGATGTAQRRAAADALVFRARRYAAATPDERLRERVLDVSEGLPEYTAWALTGGRPVDFARNIRASAARTQSYVRAFPYYTGPAYAMLADARIGGAWRRQLSAALDLQQLVARAVGPLPHGVSELLRGDSSAAVDVARLAERIGPRYGLDSVRAAEQARWFERQRQIAALRSRFVDGPVIRVRPGKMMVSFDPGRQTPLGADGTVMGGFGWRGDDGAELSAPEGALVTGDWSEFRLPRDTVTIVAGPVAERRTWRDAMWTLTLPPGWVVAADGNGLMIQRAPR